MNDWNLLQAYVREGSEAAFRELVDRHLRWVHAAALRQVGDPALAEDVAQAVFLLLARKAGSFGPGVILAGWLFRTTRFMAGRVRRTEQRRRQREQQALAMNPPADAPSENPWASIAPELDTALEALGRSDREALLLRYGEARSHREVARALGINEETARKRVTRAVDRLRQALVARGLAPSLSVTTLGLLLTDRLAVATPPDLAARVVHAATAQGLAGASLSATTLTLVEESVAAARAMWITRLAALTGAVGAVVAGVVWFGLGLGLDAPRSPAVGAIPLPGPATSAVTATARDWMRARPGGETFELRVLDAATGDPIPGAAVPVNYVLGGEWIRRDDLVTDAAGICRIPIPRGHLGRLDAGANVAGWENRFTTWRSGWPFPRPTHHTLRLARAESLSGRAVHAETSRPVVGAKVWIDYQMSDMSTREPEEDRERAGYFARLPLGVTDAEGRWECRVFPPSRTRGLITLEHPDHAPSSVVIRRPGSESDEAGVWGELVRGTQVVTLQPGYRVRGRVLGPERRPVVGARVATTWHEAGATTDADGTFELGSFPRGEVTLVIQVEGYAPRRFQAEAGGAPSEIVLEPGGELRARVTRPDGTPISGATLILEDGFGDGAMGWTGHTDADGRVVWRGAPRDRALVFTAGAEGFQYARGFSLRTDAPEQTVVLRPAFEVSGTVTDEATGDRIPLFKAIPGNGVDTGAFTRSDLTHGTNGHYRLTFSEPGAYAVRVEAEGYLPAVAQPEPGPDGEPRCDFRLQRLDPAMGVRGTVRHADGSPAGGSEVALCTFDQGVVLAGGRFSAESSEFQTVTRADSEGRFAFAPARAPHTVVALSLRGYARRRVRAGDDVALVLQPLGGIAGTVRREGRLVAGQRVYLLNRWVGLLPGPINLETAAFSALTDDQGGFRIPNVPPGDFELMFGHAAHHRLTDATWVEVLPGRDTSIVLGEPDPRGCRVSGRFRADPALRIADWSQHLVGRSLARIVESPKPPTGLDVEGLALWNLDWQNSEAGRALRKARTLVELEVLADGRFVAQGVLPGRYRLQASAVPEEASGPDFFARQSRLQLARIDREILVPETDANAPVAEVDLGDLELTVRGR